MSDIEKNLRAEAKKLLEEKKVDYVIGYEESNGKVSPCFIDNAKDVEKLVFNPGCVHNLSVYLLEADAENKVGIVAKGCDARAIVELIKQNQVARDNIFILGISCDGVKDLLGKDYDKCKNCKYPVPLIYDVLLGEKKEGKEEDYSDVEEIESMSLEERKKFWNKQFEKCIKCHACRNICPLCYCEECALDDKNWVSKSHKFPEIWMSHLIRALHTAGRCVSCGECERACPVNIPLRKLYRKIGKDVKELFDYEAGVNAEDVPPLVAFDLDKDKEKIKQN